MQKVDCKYGKYIYKTVLELEINDGRKTEIREHLKRMFWSAFKRNYSGHFNMELVESLVARGSQLEEVTT